jgi:hypothetical protein
MSVAVGLMMKWQLYGMMSKIYTSSSMVTLRCWGRDDALACEDESESESTRAHASGVKVKVQGRMQVE